MAVAVVVVHRDRHWRDRLVQICVAGGVAATGASTPADVPVCVGSAPTRVVLAELAEWIDGRDEPAALGGRAATALDGPRVVLIGPTRARASMTAAYRAGASTFVGVEPRVDARDGAFLDAETLMRVVASAIDAAASVPPSRPGSQGAAAIVGHSPAARELRAALASAARSDATTLLVGETGTGKELAAQVLHALSARARADLFAISCALAPGVVDSELFGHERGAFTGAIERRAGAFELAGAGTLLLDEVGEMPMELQARLLRVLEALSFRRVGGGAEQPFRARVVAATHRDLDHEVREGRFREDLLFRLDVERIELPPLRDRLEDIVEIANGFLARFAPRTRLSRGAAAALLEPSWRGNIRELRNVVEVVGKAQGEGLIDEAAVRRRLARSSHGPLPEGCPTPARPGLARAEAPVAAVPAPPELDWVDAAVRSGLALGRIDERIVLRTVERMGGNQLAASRSLGIGRDVVGRIVRNARRGTACAGEPVPRRRTGGSG